MMSYYNVIGNDKRESGESRKKWHLGISGNTKCFNNVRLAGKVSVY